MELQEYGTMYALENHYWWFVARRDLVAAIVRAEVESQRDKQIEDRPRIFDVGCGTGANLAALSQYGESYGIDMALEAIRCCRARGLSDLTISRVENLAYLSESFD